MTQEYMVVTAITSVLEASLDKFIKDYNKNT